jgi:hypothetical protein
MSMQKQSSFNNWCQADDVNEEDEYDRSPELSENISNYKRSRMENKKSSRGGFEDSFSKEYNLQDQEAHQEAEDDDGESQTPSHSHLESDSRSSDIRRKAKELKNVYKESAEEDEEEAEEGEEEEEEEEQPIKNRREEKKGKEKNSFVSKMREKLRKIFNFYASFGNRCNPKSLKASQFIKMMIDADITDSHLTHTKLDILFLQASKRSKTVDFEEFLELLYLISLKKFRKESDPNEAFKLLLVNSIDPLFETIYNETDMGVEDKIFNASLSVSTLLVLKMIQKPLQTIYKHFFQWEINRPLQEKQSIGKVESQLFHFLREFEICPQLIAKSSAHSLMNEIINTPTEDLCKNSQYSNLDRILGKDIGEFFTFFRFVVYFCRLGIYIFSDINNVPSTQKQINYTVDEKIYLLLERMDISNGISKIMHLLHKEKGTPQTSQHNLSLTKNSLMQIHKETLAYPNFFDGGDENKRNGHIKNILKASKYVDSSYRLNKLGGKEGLSPSNKREKELEDEEFMYIKISKNNNKRSARNSTSPTQARRSTKFIPGNLKANKENIKDLENKESTEEKDDQGPNFILSESYDLFETYLDELHRVFEAYSSFGEPGNFTTMKSSRFMKLMKDIKILDSNLLEYQDIEMIFCSVMNGMNPLNTKSQKTAKSLLMKTKQEEAEAGRKGQGLKQKHLQGANFSKFLECLEAVAILSEKEYEKKDRLFQLIQGRLIPLLQTKHKSPSKVPRTGSISKKIESTDNFTTKLMALLKDRQMIEMLGAVHKALLPLYQLYCDDFKLISSKKYHQFMKDFGIFPHLISHAKLTQLFHELYNLFKSKPESSDHIGNNKDQVIDQHLFIEGLTLVSLEVDYEKFKLTNCQKVSDYNCS